jgi:cyclopropane fatty-acyl-phospholipid synthase-like methyltransferase
MVYSNPIFSEEKILSLYRDSAIDKCIDSTSASIQINMCRYLDHLSRYSGIKKGRILDIGCGVGHLLKYAQSMEFDVSGVEPNVNAAVHSRRIPEADIKTGAYTKEMYPPGSFDLITAIHVIDHVVSPKDLLLTAKYHLKSNGYMLVATHNTASLLGLITGKNFIAYHVQHVGYFMPELLREMMNRCSLVPVKTLGSITTYPMGHFVENGIRNRKLREMILKYLRVFNLSSVRLSLPMGNMEVICKK